MTIKGILFDKDGTLLDFNATWVPANRAAALIVARGDAALAAKLLRAGGQDEAAGVVASGSLLATAHTPQLAAVWGALAPDHGLGDLVRVIDEVFQRESAVSAVAVPDLAAIVLRLNRRGLSLGIATSDSHAGALATLQPFGVMGQFGFVAGYDSGFGSKPGPGMVLGFCETTGLAPAQIMVVGDNPHDLEMGRRAGAGLCVGVLTGNSGPEQLSGLADHVVDSIADIEGLL